MLRFNDEFFTSEFDRYLEVREAGLKKEGNKILEKLMLYFDELDEDIKTEICEEFCILCFEKSKMKEREIQFFLSQRIIKILEKACDENKMPHLRWYYQMTRNGDALERAYKHELCDEKTAGLLVGEYLGVLWHGCHHFPDYCLISREYCDYLLDKISEIIQKHGLGDVVEKEYLYYKELFSEWWTWEAEDAEEGFGEWCVSKGKRYKWVQAFYFSKR